MVWQPTVREEDIPVGRCTEVAVDDEPVLLVRTGGGVVACAAYCPHKAMNLEEAQVDGMKLTCPLHGATFDLRTGAPDEDTDWAGPLPTYEARVVDGVVQVRVPVKVAS